MRIVELGEYSMAIMKDSEDYIYENPVGEIYREASRYGMTIGVDTDQVSINYIDSSDSVYTAGILVLFFNDPIPSRFHIHDKVRLFTYYSLDYSKYEEQV